MTLNDFLEAIAKKLIARWPVRHVFVNRIPAEADGNFYVRVIETTQEQKLDRRRVRTTRFEVCYTYDQDIDSDTYNKIKLVKDNKTTGKRDVYIYQDSKNMTLWGILQDYETVDESMNEAQIKERGAKMLELYNRPSRSFSLNAIADLSVRAGRVLYIEIGAVGVKSFFLIEEATHDLLKETMTLKLKVV